MVRLEIPRSLMFSLVVYLLTLAYGLNFIFSNITLGPVTGDFWLLALIILVPIVPLYGFFARGRHEIFYGRGVLMSRIAVALILLAAIVVGVFIVPLSY